MDFSQELKKSQASCHHWAGPSVSVESDSWLTRLTAMCSSEPHSKLVLHQVTQRSKAAGQKNDSTHCRLPRRSVGTKEVSHVLKVCGKKYCGQQSPERAPSWMQSQRNPCSKDSPTNTASAAQHAQLDTTKQVKVSSCG